MFSNTLNLLATMVDVLVWQRSLTPAMSSRCGLDRERHLKSEWNFNEAYLDVLSLLRKFCLLIPLLSSLENKLLALKIKKR